MKTLLSFRTSLHGSLILSALALWLCVALAPNAAHAGIIGTDEVVSEQQFSDNRERLIKQLNRTEVRAELERYGVDPEQAQERVAAMTDSEVQELTAGLDQFAAGGNISVTTLLLIIIIILLI